MNKDKLLLSWSGTFKSVSNEGKLQGPAIVFGSEDKPDASYFKDFFTESTDVHPRETFIVPLGFEHGQSYEDFIGEAIITKSSDGWNAEAQLDLDNPFVQEKFKEIKKGGWGFSTGAVSHYVAREARENGTHHITRWPVGELSVTKSPAEPRALIHSVKSIKDFYGVENELIEPSEPMEGTLVSTGDGMVPIELLKEAMNREDRLLEIIQLLLQKPSKSDIHEIIDNMTQKNKKEQMEDNEETIAPDTFEKMKEEIMGAVDASIMAATESILATVSNMIDEAFLSKALAEDLDSEDLDPEEGKPVASENSEEDDADKQDEIVEDGEEEKEDDSMSDEPSEELVSKVAKLEEKLAEYEAMMQELRDSIQAEKGKAEVLEEQLKAAKQTNLALASDIPKL